MKHFLLAPAFAVLLAGCSSVTEIGYLPKGCRTMDGETQLATVSVRNISYSLFGVFPIECGTTWKSGPYAERKKCNMSWFSDKCTVDENLASIKAALGEVGSDRVENLVTDVDSWGFWSLYLVRRKIIKTSCVVLTTKDGK